MTVEQFFLIGASLFWVGVLMIGSNLFRLILGALSPGTIMDELLRKSGVRIAIGAAALVASIVMRPDVGKATKGLIAPLAWVYMPFPGWLAVGGLVAAVWSLVSAYAEVGVLRKRQLTWAAGVYFVSGVAGFWMFRAWDMKAWIFRGAMPITLELVATILALAGAALALMVITQRVTKAKGASTKVAATLALLAGTVVFGMPLAWQLITSFKETKDQSNIDGFVWVPKVQVTHEFDDKVRPVVYATYDGTRVLARIDSTLEADKYLLEIERPYSYRGQRFEALRSQTTPALRRAPIFDGKLNGEKVRAYVAEELDGGKKRMAVLTPENLKGQEFIELTANLEPVRVVGLRGENYTEALEWLPPETQSGLLYLKNTMIIVVLSVVGTLLSCSAVAYGFSRIRFPGRDFLFALMLSTMMLPAAVTMMPTFLLFRSLGWVDTIHPLWAPSLFAGAFNVFLIKQFFSTIPIELEEAARIDGCGFFRTFWQVMLPQIKPVLAAIAVWTFMGKWNDFMGPLIYISSPEKMPIVYALAGFNSERGGDMGLMMATTTMAMLPVLLLFFFAQKYFIEGVQLSGLGGR